MGYIFFKLCYFINISLVVVDGSRKMADVGCHVLFLLRVCLSLSTASALLLLLHNDLCAMAYLKEDRPSSLDMTCTAWPSADLPSLC